MAEDTKENIPQKTQPVEDKQNANANVQGPDSSLNPERKIVKPTQVLISWEAPERLFKKRSREFYRKTAIIIIFIALLLLSIKEFLLIGVMGVVFFAVYVFHTIPPKRVKHEITTNGINYASEYLYHWEDLHSFFIEKKEGTNILNVNTVKSIPGRILLLLGEETRPEDVSKAMNEYISIIEKPEVTMMDKVVNAVSKKINI